MDGEQLYRWTRSGVRLTRVSAGPGNPRWLFVPGGPGLGSESLRELAQLANGLGEVWRVDLPGDGSNRGLTVLPEQPHALWPDVLVEAAMALEEVVMVGHSTGGMFMLAVPALEAHLIGMVLVSSAPDARWREAFATYARDHALTGVDAAAAAYARAPGDDTVRALTLAAADWNFTPAGLPKGRALLEDLPYCQEAVAWADAHFDASYQARWTPKHLPTLLLSGTEDHIVDQRLWSEAPGFTGPHLSQRWIADAGHFPWIEQPDAVRAALKEFHQQLERR